MTRKAEKKRLAAKRGWYDGHEGWEGQAPTKTVMRPFANGCGETHVSWEEEQAYWEAYDAGRDAAPDAANPYLEAA